jgi:DHA1 family multidrug resistance protein-like MFS transporter
MFAASALAANTVCRSACGAAAPLFTQYMFNALGVGGGGSLIGGVAVLLAPIPFVFYKYGGPIRERSKFAPTPERNNDRRESGVVEAERGSGSTDHESRTEMGGSSESDSTLDGRERRSKDEQGDAKPLGTTKENNFRHGKLDGKSDAGVERDLEKGQV